MEERCSQLSTELTRSKTQVLDGNYKVDNFDALKRSAITSSVCVCVCVCSSVLALQGEGWSEGRLGVLPACTAGGGGYLQGQPDRAGSSLQRGSESM